MPPELSMEPPVRTPPASVARFNRALRHQERNEKVEAAREYLGALELHTGFFEAAFNLGLLFQEMGQNQDAVGCYRHVLQCRPDLAPAWGNLGVALRDSGLELDAEASFRQSLRLHPDEPSVLNNLGNTLLTRQKYSEAIKCFCSALVRAPANAGIHLNLGNALRNAGRVSEAIQSLRRSIALKPDFAEAHWDLAYALLLQGDFVEGFQHYEWRFKRKDFVKREFASPLWLGDALAGRTLLVHTEQGAGDGIQFARFINDLPGRGAGVILECPPALAPLFESVAGAARVVPRGTALPKFDCHVSLLSLPHRLALRLEDLSGVAPYLRPPANRRVALPRAGLPQDGRLKVGVAWRGNPAHPNDRHRSIPFPALEPLLSASGVAFYNLQVAAGLEFMGEGAHVPALVSLDGALRDYADTAAIVSQLDLVISADTSVAHLAGALGRPAWVLLPFAPDWRWLLTREDSPWYQSIRLFRQSSPGDWASVIERVREALMQKVNAPRG